MSEIHKDPEIGPIEEVIELEVEEALPDTVAEPAAAKPTPKRKSFFSFKKLFYTFLILIILGSIGWAGTFFYFSYTNKFPIKTVKVIGKYQYVKEADIQNILLPYINGKGLFAFSELEAEKALEQVPGVASASIWRVPPAKIKVIVRERSAIARFPDGSLLSQSGVVFQTNNPTGANTLPLLNGDHLYAKQMLKMLESLEPVFETINAQVTGLGIAQNGDWSVQLNNQFWIMMGKNDLQTRVADLINIYPTLLQSNTNGATLTYVDLRYNHGFSAIWTGGTAPPTPTGKKSASSTKSNS